MRDANKSAEASTRKQRKTEIGVVTSTKMDKTIVVEVSRLQKHAKYAKYLKRKTRYYAHDEQGAAGVGDQVEIRETRPMSKTKRFRLVRVLKQAEV